MTEIEQLKESVVESYNDLLNDFFKYTENSMGIKKLLIDNFYMKLEKLILKCQENNLNL